ncbi:MAG: PmoA family protein [Verrucomicrobia bacterium]|nr:PmoA family protein [Verrucomicrobiota bacterium]
MQTTRTDERAGAAPAVRPDVVPRPKARVATQRYRWEVGGPESVGLVGPCGLVWRLNFAAGLAKPHFHPLQTADGRCLTQVAPPDHRWHHGLWHSWKFIDRVNYWEEDRPGGRPEGVTRIAERRVLHTGDTGARVRLRLEYHPADRDDAVVMDDTIDLAIELPREDGSYRIGWEQTARARRPVVLDRTPPPGHPDGKDWGGYTGLSFRGDRFLTEVALRTSAGRRDAEAQRQPAKWAALTGTVDGRAAGLAMFDHPANPRHPTPWYQVLRRSRGGAPPSPFWYLNAALLQNEPLPLAPGQPLTLRYLLRVDNEPPADAALESEWAHFAASAPLGETNSRSRS